jgi:hypothetical protein
MATEAKKRFRAGINALGAGSETQVMLDAIPLFADGGMPIGASLGDTHRLLLKDAAAAEEVAEFAHQQARDIPVSRVCTILVGTLLETGCTSVLLDDHFRLPQCVAGFQAHGVGGASAFRCDGFER